MKNSLFFALLFIAAPVCFGQNKVVINADQGSVKISKHIYGHFAEHLGNCIYGGFYVGEENSEIPNTNGIRNDIVDALKKLKIPNLRWPGGCFADTYHWKDGIGPKKSRPTIVNRWWGGVTEDNSFGTHDFLNLCELLGAEPYLAGNVGSGTVQELSDWLQYVNGKANTSPMSSLRVQNGREKPWNVNYWGVGNEAWGCGGNMKADYYANLYRQYATYMSEWNNPDQKFRIASGAGGNDYNWTEVLMREIPKGLVEGLALHHYAVIDWNAKGSATAFDEKTYFTTMKEALKMEELVTKHSNIMDKYDPEKKIALVVDEWGGWYEVEPNTNPGFLFQQNTMRDAMIAGATLNIFNNHADRVRMANLAQTVNVLQAVILTNKNQLILTPTYHVMELFAVHQDATLLPLHLNTTDYSFGGEKLNAVSVSASKNSSGTIHISLVNIDYKTDHEVVIDLRGTDTKQIDGRILTSAKVQDHNTFDDPEKIKPKAFSNFKMKDNQIRVKIPAHSVVVLAVK